MQSVLGGTLQKASEAVAGAMSTNKKVADMQPEMRDPSSEDRITSDFESSNNLMMNGNGVAISSRQLSDCHALEMTVLILLDSLVGVCW
jgi:hypothetical protein